MIIRRCRVFELLVVVLLVARPLTAMAEEPEVAEAERRAEAHAHFAAGTTAFAEGRFEEACRELESARVLVPTSFVTAWNASRCWETRQRDDLALASLASLVSAPDGFDLDQRRRVLAERIALRVTQEEPGPPTPELAPTADVVDTVDASPEVVPTALPVTPQSVPPSEESADRDDTLLHWLLAGSLVVASGALVTTLVLELPRSEEHVSLRIATLRFE